jgi:hypothetical protein
MEDNGLVRVTSEAIQLQKCSANEPSTLQYCTVQLFFTTIKKKQYPNFCVVASYVLR